MAECCNAECLVLFFVMLNVVILSVVMMSVMAPVGDANINLDFYKIRVVTNTLAYYNNVYYDS
jgi:hypothetical protein